MLFPIPYSLFPPPAPAQGIGPNSIITTVAGNGRVFRGDGGLATSAALGELASVAVDTAGNVFATDVSYNLVVRISLTGVVRVVAGNGISGFSGDGGPAASASLSLPRGVAVATDGNIYIADAQNSRIRKVDPDGIITTVAGTGQCCFSGDGGPATAARISQPVGLALDVAGNLYIADSWNNRIRKVSTDGRITTVAGNGGCCFSGDGGPALGAQLNSPQSVAVDVVGNLFIVDYGNHRIREVDTGGIISTVAGDGFRSFDIGRFFGDGGPATSASFNFPFGVAVDGAGNVYSADTFNGRIRKVNPSGIITTVAGDGSPRFSGDGGPASSASLNEPYGVAADAAGNLYIADSANRRIRRVSLGGIISTVAGIGVQSFGDGGPAITASLSRPGGVAVDGAGNLFTADTLNHQVRKISSDEKISTVAGNGVADFSGDGGLATRASLNQPLSVAVDTAGNLYIPDNPNQRIRKVSANGIITTVAGNGVHTFAGDGGPATSASLAHPFGVVVDSAGNLYIADTFNYRVRKVSTGGTITTVAGNGTSGSSGDGGPGTNATLNQPSSPW